MIHWAPKRHLDRFIRFAWVTIMSNRHTDRSRYIVCSNMPHSYGLQYHVYGLLNVIRDDQHIYGD